MSLVVITQSGFLLLDNLRQRKEKEQLYWNSSFWKRHRDAACRHKESKYPVPTPLIWHTREEEEDDDDDDEVKNLTRFACSMRENYRQEICSSPTP